MKPLIINVLLIAFAVSANCETSAEAIARLNGGLAKVRESIAEPEVDMKGTTSKMVQSVKDSGADLVKLASELDTHTEEIYERREEVRKRLAGAVMSLTNWASGLSDELKEKWSEQITLIRGKQQEVINELHAHDDKMVEELDNLKTVVDDEGGLDAITSQVTVIDNQCATVVKFVNDTLDKLEAWTTTLSS